MVGQHHRLNGHECEQAPGDGEGQGGLACYSPWGCKKSDTPLCVICCFFLAAFNICSLWLIFVNLINMCLGVFALGLSCLGLSGFLGLG